MTRSKSSSCGTKANLPIQYSYSHFLRWLNLGFKSSATVRMTAVASIGHVEMVCNHWV